MSGGQHVGKLADAIGDDEMDEARAVARANAEALAKLAKPIERKRESRHDLGDGDQCPAVDETGQSLRHGKMYVFGKRQYCPHSDHDGKRVDGVRQPRTQRWFPLWMDKENVA